MSPSKHAAFDREPADRAAYSRIADRTYTRVARLYDRAVKTVPLWMSWLRPALVCLMGPRVLEVAFGPGNLMSEYASAFEVHGAELNAAMIDIARMNLRRVRASATIVRASVEALPYRDAVFDSVLCTMAFSSFPDGARALEEMCRVVRLGGRLVLVDVNYPADGNPLGRALVAVWRRSGDLLRDMPTLFAARPARYTDEEIGGFGSVHLYVLRKALPVRRRLGTAMPDVAGDLPVTVPT